MSSPFEDRVWKYIAEHRPLKLVFLCVAAIGVVGSAVKTVEPVWSQAILLASRHFDSKPSAEVREKYGCAFQTGQSYWILSRFTANAPREGQLEVIVANVALQEIRLCEKMFQHSPVVTDIPTKSLDGTASAQEIKQHFITATSNWNEFQAHLATKDRQALALLRLGSEFATARMGLSFYRTSNPQGFAGPLPQDLTDDTVNILLRLHEEAQSKFQYRLPELNLATSNAAALLESIVAAEMRYSKYFRGDA